MQGHCVCHGFTLRQNRSTNTLSRQAGEEGQGGAVTLIQRFGSAANLNIHLHCLVLDDVYLPHRFRPARRAEGVDGAG